MFENAFRIAFGERSYSTSSSQATNNTPDANEEAVVKKDLTLTDMIDSPYSSDLRTLAEKYGELKFGKVIEIELHEAAELLHRQRVKVDAFNGLKKMLKNDYGVELIITSRRTKKGGKR